MYIHTQSEAYCMLRYTAHDIKVELVTCACRNSTFNTYIIINVNNHIPTTLLLSNYQQITVQC